MVCQRGLGHYFGRLSKHRLLRDAGKDAVVWTLCIVTNLIFAVMFVLALLVLPQPQVFVGASLFIAATILSLIKPRI